MERALKDTSSLRLRQGQSAFLFPGALEAEPWEAWIFGGGEARCVKVCATPSENPWPKKSTLVLPLGQVLCLPLWLNEVKPDQLSAMIGFQLEARGFATQGDNAAVYQWTVAAREEKRTLVLAGILPPVLPEALQADSFRAFDVSARYLSCPENSITLWREQGRLVAAFTRGAAIVYFQNLGEENGSPRLHQALVCLRASLEMQDIILHLDHIALWTELTPAEVSSLSQALKLPVRPAEKPQPTPPAGAWDLSPPQVVRAQKAQHSRQWKSRVLLIAFGIYLLVAGSFAVHSFILSRQVASLRQWQAEHASALDAISVAKMDWQHFQPVVDTRNYPLEVLLNCAGAIPKDRLHFTLFEIDGAKVLIKGEAKDVAAAYLLFDRLKAEPQLAGYTWNMAEPLILPNDLAQLQIEGTHATANP